MTVSIPVSLVDRLKLHFCFYRPKRRQQECLVGQKNRKRRILPGLEPGASRNPLLLQTLSENRNH
jgi:hypothetical protein